jgi:PIN domain nuclease of toxin-antitoxin system
LDSHVVIWWLSDSARLGEETRDTLISSDNALFLSAVTVWELNMKIAKGKLQLPGDYAARLLHDDLDELPVTIEHANTLQNLPPLHGDPFDRMLIAQALTERLTLLTSDRIIMRYDVPFIKA